MAGAVVLIFESRLAREISVSHEKAQASSSKMKCIFLKHFQLQLSNVECSAAIESSSDSTFEDFVVK